MSVESFGDSIFASGSSLVSGMFVYQDAEGVSKELVFQFNPETLKRSRSANFKRTEASDKPKSEPGANQSAANAQGKKYTLEVDQWKIDLDIRLDVSLPMNLAQRSSTTLGTSQTLNEQLALLEGLIEPAKAPSESSSSYGYANLPDPPMVDLIWGSRVWRGFVTSLSINETQFDYLLEPMRVEATVSFIVLEIGP